MPPQSKLIARIVVHQSNDTDRAGVRTAAIQLAQHWGARLMAVYTTLPIGMPAPVVGRAASIAYLEEMAEADRVKARTHEAEFRHACVTSKVEFEWSTHEDDPTRLLAEQLHYADVAMVAQTSPADLDQLVGNFLPDYLPIIADGPVFVVPAGFSSPSFGRRVLLAWKPCREAGRSVRDALPFLRDADSVAVLTIGKSDAPHGAGDRMAKRLEACGARVERLRSHEPDAHAGSAILSEASWWRADTIVMGAYGHSRLREFVLGGATRELLRNS
jgi:hypothetical protein